MTPEMFQAVLEGIQTGLPGVVMMGQAFVIWKQWRDRIAKEQDFTARIDTLKEKGEEQTRFWQEKTLLLQEQRMSDYQAMASSQNEAIRSLDRAIDVFNASGGRAVASS